MMTNLFSTLPKQFAAPYVAARSLVFTAESLMGPVIEFSLTRKRPRFFERDPKLLIEARASMQKLFQRDLAHIRAGLYPVDVLTPENPIKHFLRMPKMFFEGLEIAKRREARNSGHFSERAQDLLSDETMPDYYKRNFHFQGDGYLSDESAELYEHQVEILFSGAADAMRRMIIAPMKRHFAALGASPDG